MIIRKFIWDDFPAIAGMQICQTLEYYRKTFREAR
jgi:hypothetical protein